MRRWEHPTLDSWLRVSIADFLPKTNPLQKKYQTTGFLRTLPHLRLRIPFNALLARLRSDCDFYVAQFFQTNQFVRTQTPVITSSDCEGAGEIFTLTVKDGVEQKSKDEKGNTTAPGEHFFRQPKHLTVSSQLHLEAFVHEHKRVWTLAPTFRAEKSDTSRHLAEFYMLEAEIRTDELKDVMDLVENMIRDMATKVQASELAKELLEYKHALENNADKWMSSWPTVLRRRWQGLKRSYWPRITYTEAIKLLQSASQSGDMTFKYPPTWHNGLQLEHEKFIAAEIGQGSPVFVTDYPRAMKPFYMLPSNPEAGAVEDDKTTVACFDLLLPEVAEIVGGSLREHRLQPLLESMERHSLLGKARSAGADQSELDGKSDLDWYVDLRRYGSVPHGGFGLGYDRLLGYLAGVDNVRDINPWPRYYRKCDC